MKQRLLVFLFSMFFVVNIFGATTGKIAGIVIDQETDEPLAGVNIILEGTGLGASTDLEGRYFILNISPGTYSVQANMIGYKIITKKEVQVNIDETTIVNFNLNPATLEGETVVVIAEKEIVEKDLTASKEVLSSEDLSNSFAAELVDAVKTQQGVNYNGGIRGGFGLDVVYFVDGVEMRDGMTNSNYTGMAKSSIQEMQLLTGGFNAEFGRASGAVVNIVTKKARDKWHGSINWRFRPSGKYHWGPNIYDENNYENRVIGSNPEYWAGETGGEWIQQNHPDWTAEDIMNHFRNVYLNSPLVRDYMGSYTERSQQEVEGTVYGPLLPNLSLMLSGKYVRGVSEYPSLLKYNPQWNFEGNLYYDASANTRISAKVVHGGYNNSGPRRTLFLSSETDRLGMEARPSYVFQGFDPFKYYPMVADEFIKRNGGIHLPPEYVELWTGNLKLTHTFNQSTFLEASYSFFEQDFKADWLQGDFDNYIYEAGSLYPDKYPNARGIPDSLFMTVPGMNLSGPAISDIWLINSYTRKHTLKLDVTSQYTDVHLFKTGVEGNFYYLTSQKHQAHPGYGGNVNDIYPMKVYPYEFAAYIQDKIETKGMIVNVGVRMDLFNANKWVGRDIFDPFGLDEDTPGSLGPDRFSIADPDLNQPIDGSSPMATHTPTRIAFSPRIGISHPITESTVLHFMYGHFNMRPAWIKIVENPFVRLDWRQREIPNLPYVTPLPDGWLDPDNPLGLPGSPVNSYYPWRNPGGNPALDFERMVQYEVGFEQNIKNLLRFDITLFFKDAHNLTSAGYNPVGSLLSNNYQGINTQWNTTAFLFPDPSGWSIGPGVPGGHIVKYNGGDQEVRGLEFALESQFINYFNFRFLYNLSYSRVSATGPGRIDREGLVGNWWNGGNNDDQGISGNDLEVWNPNSSFKFTLNYATPDGFGPKIMDFAPLGSINLTTYTDWNQGRKFTWYPSDYDGIQEPNNKRWKDMWNTNISIKKRINLMAETNLVFSLDVINLFNQKTLAFLWNSSDLDRYMETKELPYVEVGKEGFQEKIPNKWIWYNPLQPPRQIFFGAGYEF